MSAIAELDRFRTVCVLPVFLVVFAVKVDEKKRVPELDEAVAGIRFVFLVKRQLGCFVRLEIRLDKLLNELIFAEVRRNVANHNVGSLVVTIFDLTDQFVGDYRNLAVVPV